MNTDAANSHDYMLGLVPELQTFDDAGIDPAFDAEYEELERQFAELQIASDSN